MNVISLLKQLLRVIFLTKQKNKIKIRIENPTSKSSVNVYFFMNNI